MDKGSRMGITVAALLLVGAALGGCSTRSISDSGPVRGDRVTSAYAGELDEFDVLGVDQRSKITEADIGAALDQHSRPVLHRGDRVMLVQSGAQIPDSACLDAVSEMFSVSTFSGAPQAHGLDARHSENAPYQPYAPALRLAAAKAGATAIVVYWGSLETSQQAYATNVVSWVPVVGWVIPDQTQTMRLQLKIAVIDTRTGSWDVLVPDSVEDRAMSAHFDRDESDQAQVEALKRRACPAAIQELAHRFAS